MNGGRAAYRVWRRLRQAEVANLSLADEIGHGADGFFDRRFWIDPVLIVEIDHLDPESLEACLARLANISRITPGAEHRAFGVAHPSELRRKQDGVALTVDRAAEQLFVAADPVRVRAVKKCNAAFDGVMEGGNRLFIVAAGIEIRHSHAAESNRGNLQTSTTKLTHFHVKVAPSFPIKTDVASPPAQIQSFHLNQISGRSPVITTNASA